MYDSDHIDIGIAWKMIKTTLEVYDTALNIISGVFDTPCNWSKIDEYMAFQGGNWCEDNCHSSHENNVACWRKFFELKTAGKGSRSLVNKTKNIMEKPKPLNCEFCGRKLIWENPHISEVSVK